MREKSTTLHGVESAYAWMRLTASLAPITISGQAGAWVGIVLLATPPVAAR